MAGRVIFKLWEAPLAVLANGVTGSTGVTGTSGLYEGEIGIAQETGDLWKRPDGNPTGPLIPLASNPPAVSVAAGTTTLTQQQSGLVVVSAAGGNVTINLPEASLGAADYRFFRTDNTANTVEVVCYNTDTFYLNQVPVLNGNGQQYLLLETGLTELTGDGVSGYLVTSTLSEPVSALTVYVADPTTSTPPGNDNNNGLSPTTAFATIQRAWNYIQDNVVSVNQTLKIKVAPGTYTGGLYVQGTAGVAYVNIVGSSGNPNETILNVSGNAFDFRSAAAANLNGFTISATGVGIFVSNGAAVSVENVYFGNCNIHAASDAGGVLQFEGPGGPSTNYTIGGNAAVHLQAADGGTINMVGNGSTVCTIVGEPSIGIFAVALANGDLNYSGIVFSGVPAPGCQKYAATFNGSILVNGSGTGYLPGSVAGVTSNGGTYG